MSTQLVVDRNQTRSYDYDPTLHIEYLVSASERPMPLDMVESRFDYLGGPPLHLHREQCETDYVIEGELEYHINGETFVVKSGGCIHIPKQTPHASINLQSEPAKIISILTPGGFEGFFQTLDSLPTVRENFDSIVSIAKRYGVEIIGPPLAISLGLANESS